MTWTRLPLVLLLVFLAPAVARSQDDAVDPHLRLRTRAGLPVSSAHGDIRIFSEAYLSGGGATSLVARRERYGRWVVSRVAASGYAKTRRAVRTWRLKANEAAELEALLDSPGAFAPEAEPAEMASCLDPPSTDLEVLWRGHAEQVYQGCGAWGVVDRIQRLLMAGRS